MSNAHIIDIESAYPQIPTQFDADTGSAVPVGNVLEILGVTVANGTYSTPLHTAGSGNTITANIQVASAITGAPGDKNDAGIASFDDTVFAVDSDGYVTLIAGPGPTVDSVIVDNNTAPGTNPVLSDASGQITISGAAVANHSVPIESHSRVINALNIEVQVAKAISTPPVDKNDAGICSFDSDHFSIDSNGFVTLSGGGTAVDSFTTDIAGPVAPDVFGNVNITNGQVFSDGSVANTIGLSVEATQYTFLYGEGNNVAMTELGPLTNGQVIIGSTGAAPVAGSLTQPAAGLTITGGAGSITFALANDLAALEGLGSTGYAVRTAADTWAQRTFQEGTGIDLTNADGVAGDTTIAVDITEIPTVATTYTCDSGSATPAVNNINIYGGPGVTTSGSGSTITINSVVYTDQTATTLTSDSGTFATAAGAYTLPASPSQGELIEIVCITTGIVVTANAGQEIQLGGDVTSTAGTATNSAKGDALVLRYRSSDTAWYAISSMGVWSLA